MLFDNEEQRQTILHALVSQPIQGDYEGIMQLLPRYTEVVEAVKAAKILNIDAVLVPDAFREEAPDADK